MRWSADFYSLVSQTTFPAMLTPKFPQDAAQDADPDVHGIQYERCAGPQIMRLAQVIARTGLSRSSIYNFMGAQHGFPKTVLLGARAVGWVDHEVDAWLASRIRAR